MKKEQIEKKAKEEFPDEPLCSDGFTRNMRQSFLELFRKCFIQGAEFALSHQWVSVEDELPKESSEYLISDGKRYKLGDWDADLKIWENEPFMGKDGSGDVTHWMPIPPMAEKGGEDD